MDAKYLIDKVFIEDYDLSGEALAVMIAIKMKNQKKEAALSCGLLEYYIFGYSDTNRNKRDSVVKGFNELLNKDVIMLQGKLKDNVMICDISKILDTKKDRFYTSISKEEFNTIINTNEDVNNYALLKFFLRIVGTFDSSKNMKSKYKFKIGTVPQTLLSSICQISISTLIKYNNVLIKNNIMYVVNRKTLKLSCNTGKLYNAMSNIYSRYEDRDLCEKYLVDNGFYKKDKAYVNISNEMRSLSQTYNYFQRKYKDKICEDIDKVNKAYSAAKLWNQYTKEDYERKIENGEHPSKPKYKDLSIFEQYGLTD